VKRKSRLRIVGDDRLLMMLAKDVRRRWLQYGQNRKLPEGLCEVCEKVPGTEIDHILPVGARPRIPQAFGDYIEHMVYAKCQRLCKECHYNKTKTEREKRRKT
jgi:hypothetical protein